MADFSPESTAAASSEGGDPLAPGGSVLEHVSAERAAADSDDFESFDKAHVSARAGKDVPTVERKTPRPAEGEGAAEADGDEPAKAAAVSGISKRQQAINDLHRRIAEQDAELVKLRAPAQRPAATTTTEVQPKADAPKPEGLKERAARILALPDAPKVDDFDSITDYHAAQTLFIQEKVGEAQQAARGQEQAEGVRIHRLIERDRAFGERIATAIKRDPKFVESLSDEAKNIGGMNHAQRHGVEPGPQHVVGELMYDSLYTEDFLRHVSANPGAMAALTAIPPHIAAMHPNFQKKAHIDHIVSEFRRLEGRLAYLAEQRASTPDEGDEAEPSIVSAAPDPAPVLRRPGRSSDPGRSALERDDFEAFDEQEVAKKIRKRKGAA